jgi:signal transduction histidine kinase
MDWHYHYSPDIWPGLASAAVLAVIAAYSWRRRSVPGALPLAMFMLTGFLWSVSVVLKLAADDVPTAVFWAQFQWLWQLAAATTGLWFALEYASFRRRLIQRTLVLLVIPLVVQLLLMATNDIHHSMWSALSSQKIIELRLAAAGWILSGFGYLLTLISFAVLVWFFLRSPSYRKPIGLILLGQVAVRAGFLVEFVDANLLASMDPAMLACLFSGTMYSLALFRFRLLDPMPVAREIVIDQMQEGMLVLDTRGRIVDLNPAAARILGMPRTRLRGHDVTQVLPAYPGPGLKLPEPAQAWSEISLGPEDATRRYALHLSPLKDRRDVPVGSLILLHDVTEQRRTQAQLLEHQRAVATLQERERLARELHDGVGQVLGYLSIQAQAIGKRVHDGDTATAEVQLRRLADVAQDAHEDIRESILSLKAGAEQEWSFPGTLKQYLDRFREHYGIHTELTISPGLELRQAFQPGAGVQLLRVIQEALANARKHGRARHVRVAFEFEDGQALIVVADDGCGFNPDQLPAGSGEHLGLPFMRQRVAEIGGSLLVQSRPGAGTRVMLWVPIDDGGGC